jgi:outer membrane protein OmpA-like peptidoglycan-associated protein
VAVTDAYTGAKTNLRDNVKTLVGVFGAVVGLLLAGTPFSGYGAVELWSLRWFVATLALLGAVASMAWALRILLFVLRTDLAYSEDLVTNFSQKPPAGDPMAPEMKALQAEFAKHKHDLLPRGVDSVNELDAAADKAWDKWLADRTEANRKFYDDLVDTLQRLNYWSAFVRFHFRVGRGTDKCLGFGLLALLFIAAFALAASPPKQKEQSPPQVVVINTLASSDKPALDHPMSTIPFETNRWAISAEALKRIGTIRDHLRGRPQLGVLVFGYTDTRGEAKLNQNLAQRRATAVVQALVTEGGISPSRVFTATLPKTDLPSLTSQEVDSQDNRAVELRIVDLPNRK